MEKENLHKLSHNELLARCAWCHRVIPEESEVFGAGTKIQPGFEFLLKNYAGKVFPMPLQTGREIIVMVPTANSEAHKAGNDLYFQACSEKCCQAIKEAIHHELTSRKN